MKFCPLLKIAMEWAVRDEQPELLVLRRICQWAIADGFSSGTFISESGEAIRPFDLYMSFRISTEPLDWNSAIVLGGEIIHIRPGEWSENIIGTALIGVEGVQAFCRLTDTSVPASLESGFSLSRIFRSRPKHRSPPDCPYAEESAARFYAREQAAGTMSTLKEMIQNPRQYSTRRFGPNTPFDLEGLNSRWQLNFESAKLYAARSADAELVGNLDALLEEWETITKGTAQRDKDQPPQRRRGRPTGSGSYEDLDRDLVEEMRDMIRQGSTITGAAEAIAHRAAGGGTQDSRAKRLARRYSEAYPS